MDNRQNNHNRFNGGVKQPQRPTHVARSNVAQNSQHTARPNGAQRAASPHPAAGQRQSPVEITQEHMRSQPQVDVADSSNKIFYTVMAITSALALALIISLFCFAISQTEGCSKNQNDTPKDDTQSGIPPTTDKTVLGKTDDMGQEYIDSMIFVGDSNTAHLRSSAVLTGGKETKQVWATESQTITLNSQITSVKIVYPETGELMTIAEALALKKPQYLVISLGTNGVSFLSKEDFKYCYGKLLKAVKEASPSTKVIVQSIYPVTESYEHIPNSRIDEANEWLLELARENGVRYADTASVLKDSKGYLKTEYNSEHGDGYHVSTEAYKAILQYLRTHGYQ